MMIWASCAVRRWVSASLICVTAGLAAPAPAIATVDTAEPPRDTGFGPSGPSVSTTLEQDLEKGADEERLRIGGSLEATAQGYLLDGSAARRSYFFNPSSLRLYFEAKLKNDIRGFGKFRATYDPVAGAAGIASPLSTAVYPRFQSDLEELKLQFHASRRVFFTLGKQKIRWGSGRFWNPTDFLNATARDPLSPEDLRSGVSLVKTHVPIGAANAYLVQRVDGADRFSKIQNAARVEAPLWEASELAVSGAWTSGSDPALGLDLSSAVVGNLDGNIELAAAPGTDAVRYTAGGPEAFPDRWRAQVLAGLSYDFPYADRDVFTLAAEYFRNPLGLTSSDDYLWTLLAGAYRPYRLSRDYAMVYAYLPGPGSWDDWTFIVFELFNLNDGSTVTRPSVIWTGQRDLRLDAGVSFHLGDSAGEFRMGGQRVDFSARIRIEF